MTGMLEGWAKGEKQQFDEQYRTWQAQQKTSKTTTAGRLSITMRS
jgi:hypothetical protein